MMMLKDFILHIRSKKKERAVADIPPVIKKEQIEKKNVDDQDGMVNGEYEILEREIMPERIVCPECGGYTLEGLEFCDKCGGDLTNL